MAGCVCVYGGGVRVGGDGGGDARGTEEVKKLNYNLQVPEMPDGRK